MLSFIQRYALLMSGVAFMAFTSPLAFAATTGGVDTPSGVQTLPLAVEGTAVITLTDNPTTAAAVNGNLSASGTIQLGLFTAGDACSNKGAIGFDSSKNLPVFCNGVKWALIGQQWTAMAMNPGGWIALIDPITNAPFTTCYTNYAGITVQQFPAGTPLNFLNYFTGASAVQNATAPTWAYMNNTGHWVAVGGACVY